MNAAQLAGHCCSLSVGHSAVFVFTALNILLTSCFLCDNFRRHWSPGADIHDENVVWQSQDVKEEVTDVLKYCICHCCICLTVVI